MKFFTYRNFFRQSLRGLFGAGIHRRSFFHPRNRFILAQRLGMGLWLLSLSLGAIAQAPAITWQKALGGEDIDQAYAITASGDGGFVVAGYSLSNDGDVAGNHGWSDYWVVRLDGSGNKIWQKTLGGSGYDVAQSIVASGDGGFVVAGYSLSNDGDVTGNHGDYDYWVVKLDANGNKVWQKSLGGSSEDQARAITASGDGGFVVAGSSASKNGDVTGNHGELTTG